MSTLLEQIQNDVKDAMRARDTERTQSLRMLVAALQDEAKSKLRDLESPEELAVLTRERKKRAEAEQAFTDGGAPDRAEKERVQRELIDAYLPAQLGEEEIEQLVTAAIAETGADSPKQMGQVMAALKPKIAGRADGKVVSETVKRLLAG